MARQREYWNLAGLTDRQRQFITAAMRNRFEGDLGPLELAGLLQENDTFTPMRYMKRGDVSNVERPGTTLGNWSRNPQLFEQRAGPQITINEAFPSVTGSAVGHELIHEALWRAGLRGKGLAKAHHERIRPYLTKHYERGGLYKQRGVDVSRGERGDGGVTYREANPNVSWKSDIKKPTPRLLKMFGGDSYPTDIIDTMVQSEEGKTRQKWWNENRNKLLQMIFRDEHIGRGR